MATPPVNKLIVSTEELNKRFQSPEWVDRVQTCKSAGRSYTESMPGRGNTLQKVFHKYWDDDDNVIAVLFRYKRQNGEKLVVRMLREGDTVYSGPPTSGTPTT